MKKELKCVKKCLFVVTLAFFLAISLPAWAERPVRNSRQYRNNMAYNKNALPAGWQLQTGYAVWRAQRKMPLNQQTYRRYRNDKVWHNKMRFNRGTEQFLLNNVDWTIEELALLLQQNQNWFKFHPAGYE